VIYHFDTDREDIATAALLVYAVWQSRDRSRYRITPDVWSQQERFIKSAAKRARTLSEFIEAYKAKVFAGTLSPKAMEVGIKGSVPLLSLGGGAVLEVATPEDNREFLVGVIERADQQAVLRCLYAETAYVVLHVRDRIERERPLESRIAKVVDGEDD
jgi:hypothetical protein